ncbi:MAG: hypothetical protein CVU61_11645 [Deltaproteobacteria bacterium HGW-Deltaproteobacteria-19]|nr:MAG: hypothetical protein CVU61_11645 [Deltaproteobacteria bacterium HGW-Deltaproteobacteria-19]
MTFFKTVVNRLFTENMQIPAFLVRLEVITLPSPSCLEEIFRPHGVGLQPPIRKLFIGDLQMYPGHFMQASQHFLHPKHIDRKILRLDPQSTGN